MAETNARRENHPGRSDEDFKPWLDRKTAAKVVVEMKMQGCAICGATESKAVFKKQDGTTAEGESWAQVLDNRTGQERLICRPCAKLEFGSALSDSV